MRPTLYEAAGGERAFLALAAAHHARCLADPELNHPFSHPGQHPQHVERLAAYWAEVLGGPPNYSQECGGDQSGLVHMHSGNGDMGDLGQRFVECFVLAADDAGLPGDPELRAALYAYMEWAVQDVALSHPDDSDARRACRSHTGPGTASSLLDQTPNFLIGRRSFARIELIFDTMLACLQEPAPSAAENTNHRAGTFAVRRVGVRDHNRPGNLELWTRPQPSGIRVADAVTWAREILARYGEEVVTSNNAQGLR